MDKKEIAGIIEQFLNEQGQWANFTDFLETQGYTLAELGFNED